MLRSLLSNRDYQYFRQMVIKEVDKLREEYDDLGDDSYELGKLQGRILGMNFVNNFCEMLLVEERKKQEEDENEEELTHNLKENVNATPRRS